MVKAVNVPTVNGDLTQISDEEFLHNLSTSGVLKRYDGLNDRVQELIRRYKFTKDELGKVRNELTNKKNECQILRAQIDRAERDILTAAESLHRVLQI